MKKFNSARKLFDFKVQASIHSPDSVIYITSDSDEETSDSWDSDWSTDTEKIIKRIEHEAKSSPILIGGRAMTVESLDDEVVAGPSNSQLESSASPKLGPKYFDKKLCYAPPRKTEKNKIELCKTLLPVIESPLSPPDQRGDLLKTSRCNNLWIGSSMRPTTYKAHNRTRT